MSFSEMVVRGQFRLQQGRCALCGQQIVQQRRGSRMSGGWEAHHIDGNGNNDSAINCACVHSNDEYDCHLETCHYGDFEGEEVLPLVNFRFLGR